MGRLLNVALTQNIGLRIAAIRTALGNSPKVRHCQASASLACYFDGNLITHHQVNWLAPLKIRRTLIGGARQMIVYDDLEPSEKIKVYDKGITVTEDEPGAIDSRIGYRTGDMWAPQVSLVEGLRVEAQHFVDCIEHCRQPVTDGLCGLRVTWILEAAAKSLSQRGQPR